MSVRTARRALNIVLVALVVLDLAAAIVLLTPLGGSRERKQVEFTQVRLQLQEERAQAKPLENIEQKLADARLQIAQFIGTRLPQRDSAISEELGRVAGANGVRFANIRYTSDDAATEGLRRVQIDASLAGDYGKVVKFINELERNQTFFIIDSINLADQQGGAVRLELKLETYLKAAPGT